MAKNDSSRTRVLTILEQVDEVDFWVEINPVKLKSLDCLNCGRPIPRDENRFLFCMEFCALLAASVRYHRRTISDGRFDSDPLVRSAIQVRLNRLSDGVVVRPINIPDHIRSEVFARTRGQCSNDGCSNPATEIDHIKGRGFGDDVENLQGLCHSCHLGKIGLEGRALSAEMISERSQVIASGLLDKFIYGYAVRVRSESPQLECDDPVEWERLWRTYLKMRRTIKRNERVGLKKAWVKRELSADRTKQEISAELAKNGFTQIERAELLKVSISTIRKWPTQPEGWRSERVKTKEAWVKDELSTGRTKPEISLELANDGFTQVERAELLKVSIATIQRWRTKGEA